MATVTKVTGGSTTHVGAQGHIFGGSGTSGSASGSVANAVSAIKNGITTGAQKVTPSSTQTAGKQVAAGIAANLQNASTPSAASLVSAGIQAGRQIYANNLANSAANTYSGYSGGSSGGGGRSGGSGGSGGSAGYDEAAAQGYMPNYASGSVISDPSTANPGLNPNAGNAVRSFMSGLEANLPTADIRPVDLIDTTYQRQLLDQIKASQERQAQGQIDYAVSQGVNELWRNVEDSKEKYQTMRNQVDRDERQALDNQVLYAEARGDRGGLGQAQYGSIQNTAAVNRLAVNQAQTKLATDTARQVADLRAQGEFEKADKLLEISQNYLGKLMDLYQYAQSTNVSIQEFNEGLRQWLAEYALNRKKYLTDTELEAANLFGADRYGNPTQAAWQSNNALVADAASALLNAGVAPTTQQLAALGMTSEQAMNWINNWQQQQMAQMAR